MGVRFSERSRLLIKAVAADPNYPLSHSALSEALWHMGYLSKARTEAQRALDLSGHLPQEEQLLVEGQYRRSIADWPKTVEAYQTLFHLFPDRLDYGLLLASSQIESSRLIRCRHWRLFAIFLRRRGTMHALT